MGEPGRPRIAVFTLGGIMAMRATDIGRRIANLADTTEMFRSGVSQTSNLLRPGYPGTLSRKGAPWGKQVGQGDRA
jgi:hypothetical protein